MSLSINSSVNSVSSFLYNSLPSARQTASNVLKISLPAIALVGAMWAQQASAGPITYGSCVAGCSALAPPAIGACLAACLPFLGPHCP